MYRCSKRVLAFLASMFCIEVTVLGVIVGMPPPTVVGEFYQMDVTPVSPSQHAVKYIWLCARSHCLLYGSNFIWTHFLSRLFGFITTVSHEKNRIPGTNNYSPGLFICADGDPPHQHWTAYYWTCALVVDTTVLLMALYKAWAYRLHKNQHSLMRVLTRDSILYFVV